MGEEGEIGKGVDMIVKEVVSCEEEESGVRMKVEKVDGMREEVKEKMSEGLKEMMDVVEFEKRGYEKMGKWYIEGGEGLEVVVEGKKKKGGMGKVMMME